MSKKIGRVSATVLGLIAGIIHGIVGIIAALALVIAGGFIDQLIKSLFGGFSGQFSSILVGVGFTVVGIIVFVIALLNLIGGCIVRRHRIAGGVLMLITSIPIIVFSLSGTLISLAFIWLLITGLMSFIAAILAFVPYSDRYKTLYEERKQRKLNKNAPPIVNG